jgi:hypothetical protein
MSQPKEVSIITCSYNRHKFLVHMKEIIKSQDYPHNKMEWVIIDDTSIPCPEFVGLTNLDGIDVRYIHLASKIALAKKRDYLNHAATGRYLVNMDDDDFYPPSRVSRAVRALKEHVKTSGKPQAIVGSTIMYMFFALDHKIYRVGPYGENHGTAATLAYTKEYADAHQFYHPELHGGGNYAEESGFTDGWKQKMVQLDPKHTILAISHSDNTVDKTIFLEQKYGQMGTTVHLTEHVLSDFIFDPEIRKFYEEMFYVKKESAIRDKIEERIKSSAQSVAERYRQTMTKRMKDDIRAAKIHLQRLEMYNGLFVPPVQNTN